MTDERFDQFAEDVRYIRARVDKVHDDVDVTAKNLADFRVSVEHRLTKVEVKSGILGIIGGALAALGISWGKP